MTKTSFAFGAIENALGRYFDVPLEDAGKFRARIKQLQRLEFPAGVNVGRGVKMPYGTDHLLKLVLAFELIDCGLTASPATKIVEANWNRFRAGIGASAMAAPHSSLVFASIMPNLMKNVSGEAARVSIDDEASRVNIEQSSPWGAIAHLTICLTSMVARLVDRTQPTKNLPNFFMNLELREWSKPVPLFDAFNDDEDWFRLGRFDQTGSPK